MRLCLSTADTQPHHAVLRRLRSHSSSLVDWRLLVEFGILGRHREYFAKRLFEFLTIPASLSFFHAAADDAEVPGVSVDAEPLGSPVQANSSGLLEGRFATSLSISDFFCSYDFRGRRFTGVFGAVEGPPGLGSRTGSRAVRDCAVYHPAFWSRDATQQARCHNYFRGAGVCSPRMACVTRLATSVYMSPPGRRYENELELNGQRARGLRCGVDRCWGRHSWCGGSDRDGGLRVETAAKELQRS